MNLRHAVSVLGVTAFSAATFLSIGTAHANPTPDWGENVEGLQVNIHNTSSVSLPFFVQPPWGFGNIKSRSGNLGVGNHAHIHGKWLQGFGEPADIDFEYRQSEGMFVPGIGVRAQTRSSDEEGHSVSAECVVNFSRDLDCSVAPVIANKPIEIVVSDKHR